MRDAVLQDYRRTHAALGFAIADLRCELAFRRLLRELKANFNPAQPRAPRGSSIGGQWIGAGPTNVPVFREPRRAWANNVNDGVYRPGEASPFLTVGGSRSRIGGNRPPPEHTTLQQIFPGLRTAPADAILAPLDNFLGLSAPGEAANLAVNELQFRSLYSEMRKLDPSYRPPDSFQTLDQMSWQVRNGYLELMRMDRATALYKIRAQIEPLQIETLRFVQRRVDLRYTEAVVKYDAGELDVHLGRNEAIGNYIDAYVREDLRAMFSQHGISTAPGQAVRVNRRAYTTSSTERTFKLPDVRVGDLALDMSMTQKSPGSQQIRGFFSADFQPKAVVIVRPSALGKGHTYLITRPVPKSGR